MPKITSEAAFEDHIASRLVEAHEYVLGAQDQYDPALCLYPATVVSFIRATQPEAWKNYCDREGDRKEAEAKLLKRLKDVIDKEGTLHVLRHGFDIIGGGHFDLCYFQPTSGLNEEAAKLCHANIFHVQRQLYFEAEGKKSLDLGIFLNGLPVFTAELKNQQSGQSVLNGIKQYRTDRDPNQPLFRFKRCLCHFAVDTQEIYMATQLAGAKTFFLPFNQGYDGGAGNPPSKTGFATSYFWEEILAKESVLDLVQRFIRVIDKLDDKGKKTGKQQQIFPRFHQMSSVRQLTDHSRAKGSGHSYLNQHSAGSGKTNCIAWLANALAELHGADDKPVFSSVIVISDRRVIDRQLQRTLGQVVETPGKLINISSDDGMTSRHLKTALEDGKRIIVTTLQKFGVIVDSITDLPGQSFAVIIDEAHSSQTGEAASAVQKVLSGKASGSGAEEEEEEITYEDRIAEEVERRGRLKNVSYFAFTATPKEKTLELFGTKQKDGTFLPFTLYTMRQAIEERFILDVLKNYTTYDQYWALLKTVEDDPDFEDGKVKRLLKQFVSRDQRTIDRKAKIAVDHFLASVQGQLGGKAKGMIVTASRLHAVRYKLAVDKYLDALGNPFKALVAFTDTVKDPDDEEEYTEAGMNGFPEKDTADRFEADENRLLIVASKFQTGFDQPKLVAMYVDRKLQGVTCVQTLSRLNRIAPGKEETFVLDFENDDEDIRKAFQPFYDRIILTKPTDPNALYDIRTNLKSKNVYVDQHVEDFAKAWFAKNPKIEKLHALTDPVVEEWRNIDEDEQADFKSNARDFVALYSFLSQMVSIGDPELEKLFWFLKFLVPKLKKEAEGLPVEVLEMVDLTRIAIRYGDNKDIGLERGQSTVDPLNFGAGAGLTEEEKETLSKIIDDLNTRFQTKFTEDEILVIKGMEKRLSEDEGLQNQLKHGSRDAVRASFDTVALDVLQDLMDDHWKFYKKVNDDQEVSKILFDRLFDWYYQKNKEGDKKSA